MIEVSNLTIQAGKFEIADVSFTIPTGAYGMLMGKTGCGKTTIMEAICGLKQIKSGTIKLLGRDVTNLKPAERQVGFVPQDASLFRTMTVRDQLMFALKVRKWPVKRMRERAVELAEMLGIENLLDRKPFGLSGGEGQRVALGRALSFEPKILCLDEPLSSIDHDTRLEMCDLLEMIREKTRVTALHITHSKNEAARLADMILRIEDGKVIMN